MSIKEMRMQTGLSQSRFANLFDIPIATLRDWEQERRKPPVYVINMIQEILEYKGLIISQKYIEECEERRKSVERAVAIVTTATEGPDEVFMDALELYISGELSLEQLEENIDRLVYIGG
jgi:transcriptional regulator with XRE-family HTH domain